MRKAFFLVLAVLGLGACTSLDCSVDNVVMLNVSIPDTLKADTLDVYTIVNGKDTALYTNGTGITSLSLPMSYSQDADQYLFTFTDKAGVTSTDTVVIGKTNQPRFESVDCTPQFWHTITSATTTHHRVDDISINEAEVNNDQSKKHIILHLRRD